MADTSSSIGTYIGYAVIVVVLFLLVHMYVCNQSEGYSAVAQMSSQEQNDSLEELSENDDSEESSEDDDSSDSSEEDDSFEPPEDDDAFEKY